MLRKLSLFVFAVATLGATLAAQDPKKPAVPDKEVAAIRAMLAENANVTALVDSAMTKTGVDWQLISYGGAVHAFTDSGAGNDPSRGAAYNEKADKRSWHAMKSFFAEIFDHE